MKVCMIVPNAAVKGGIASVVNGYRGSVLEQKYKIRYVESYRDGNKWQKLGKALCGYCVFLGQILCNRPDIVHIHSSFGPSFYRKMPFIYMSCLFGIPVINHIHGAEFDRFYEKASERKKKRIARVYGKCARLIVLSEEWKERIAAFVPKERIEVLENYCKIPKEPYDTGRKAEQVLFMGELGRRKGCYDIPAIWAQVLKEVPSARLVMAGDGEMEAVKKAFVKQGIRSGVVFPGWVRHEEKEKLFRESAVFLLPTYNEGMPMVVLEAMGYGLGIVTTNVGGIPKLLQNGINGCIEKPGELQAMAQDVVRLLREPELCGDYGRKARELVKREYSAERHIERLCAVYNSLSHTRERRYGQKMGQLGRALASAVRITGWKCRYGSRLQTSWVQGFEHPHLEIAPGAFIRLGERIQNRGNLYLICGQKGKLRIGAHVFMNTGCSVSCMEEIVIGDHCKIGNNVVIVDHDHNYKNSDSEYLTGKIVIGNRVWIGANVTILRNTHIGDGCVIAAGSIVKGDVPAGTLYYQKRQTELVRIENGGV